MNAQKSPFFNEKSCFLNQYLLSSNRKNLIFNHIQKPQKLSIFRTDSQSIEKNACILAPKFRKYKTNGKEMFREVLRIN